jgi:predicted methyltransferase
LKAATKPIACAFYKSGSVTPLDQISQNSSQKKFAGPRTVKRDAARKPAETVSFARVKTGMVVAERPGRGYYTRILAKAVGPIGKVYARVNATQAARPGGLDALNVLAAVYPNIKVVTVDYAVMALPEKADLIWTTENYHDFHNGPTADIAALDKSVFNNLKPGGVFSVEDHSAVPGAGVPPPLSTTAWMWTLPRAS